MKTNKLNISLLLLSFAVMAACGNKEDTDHANEEEDHQEEREEAIHLSQAQFDALKMKIDSIPVKNMASVVEANGELEVPPQNEATVTAIMGGNIASIAVIEGDNVKKGQALAWLTHPSLTAEQTQYLEAYSRLQFLQEDYQRQKRLYEAEVGSGKNFQRARSEYNAAKATVGSFESQLRQLGLNPQQIRNGKIAQQVPVKSPITGSIAKVEIKIGQYVQPETNLFEVVNIEHIHADLMVFEKDVYKVKEGQKVKFEVETLPGSQMEAVVYSVGKTFEKDPKAVHVHAEIENKPGRLIPGMYVTGEIITDHILHQAMPEEAIAKEEERLYIFRAEKETGEDGAVEWMFTPVEITTGVTHNNWIAITLMDKVPENSVFAMNNAYYIIAEWKKGEAEHSH